MENSKPLVSIIIPVYNGSDYLKEAIDSAIAQTYENIEIIVVNDGSNDNGATEKIALSYGDKIRYLSKENGGVSSALNLGIESMRGEYFSWLSHDDMYTADKIEKSVAALDFCEDKNALIHCASMQIDKDSMPLKKKDSKGEPKYVSWKEALLECLNNGSYGGCSFLIPKKAFDICGKFDESLRFIQDTVMWENFFFNKFSIFKIPDICVKYRVHGNQLTQRGQALFRKESEKVSDYMILKLLEVSTKETNLIKAYALNNAKYNNKPIVKKAVFAAKKAKLLTISDRVEILAMRCYGTLRPFIRRMYYRLFRKIKTS